jgi:hypothetical protein
MIKLVIIIVLSLILPACAGGPDLLLVGVVQMSLFDNCKRLVVKWR